MQRMGPAGPRSAGAASGRTVCREDSRRRIHDASIFLNNPSTSIHETECRVFMTVSSVQPPMPSAVM
jgi:hypothetical protein